MYTYLFHSEEKTVEFVSKEDIREAEITGRYERLQLSMLTEI
jgi:hypothetical protein